MMSKIGQMGNNKNIKTTSKNIHYPIIFLVLVALIFIGIAVYQQDLISRNLAYLYFIRGFYSKSIESSKKAFLDENINNIQTSQVGFTSSTYLHYQFLLTVKNNINDAIEFAFSSKIFDSDRQQVALASLIKKTNCNSGDYLVIENSKIDIFWSKIIGFFEVSRENKNVTLAQSWAILSVCFDPREHVSQIEDPAILLNLADAYYQVHDFNDSIIYYQKYYKKTQNKDPSILLNLADAYFQVNDFTDSVVYYVKYYEKTSFLPDSDWALHRIALYYIYSNEIEKAKNILLSGIKSHPDYEGVRSTLGYFYLTQNQLDESLQLLQQSINTGKSVANKAWSYELMAEVYLKLGNTEKAIESLEASGRLYELSNRFQDAESLYKGAISRNEYKSIVEFLKSEISRLEDIQKK